MDTSDDASRNSRATAARLAWSPDGLRVPRDLSTGSIARTTLSVSSAGTIESCPARWAGEKLFPVPETPFDPTVIGNAGHDVLEALFNRPGPDRTPDTAARILDDLVDEALAARTRGEDHDYAFAELTERGTRLQWISAVWNGIVTLWDIEDPPLVDVWATEYEVRDVDVGGVPFGGFIDRIDRVTDKHGQPGLALRDYKTGRYIDTHHKRRFGDAHGDQLRLYAEAVETILADRPTDDPDHGLKVVEAHDYYTKHGKATKVALSAPYRKATVAAHAATWATHHEITTSGLYPATPSGLCTYCPLVRQCPFRSENVKWGKVKPTALTVAEAPIVPPLDAYASHPRPIPFGEPWDSAFTIPDWGAEEWDDDDPDDLALPQTGPVGLPIPASMDPFAGIEEGRYVAERDPFRSPLRPAEVTSEAGAHGAPGAAAQSSVQTTLSHSEATMNDTASNGQFFEDVPYKDDPMNISSYRHLSANHLVNKALGQLRRAGIGGPDLTQQLITSTASVLWNVVTTVQEQIVGHRNLQSSVARNLLYSLDEVLELDPMPLVVTSPDGQRRFATRDEITAWGVTAVGRLGALSSIGVGLAHNGGNLAAASDFRGNPLGVRRGSAPAQPGAPGYSGQPQFQPAGSAEAPDQEPEPSAFDPAFNY